MKDLNRSNYQTGERPVRILQFGEGNFLRAFVDWILQDLNNSGVINSDVAVVQPMPSGRVKELADQDGLYTLCLEGIDNGEKVQSRKVIDVLRDFIDPFKQYDKYLAYAKSEELEIVISNTTEAGIALDTSDTDFSACPKSFPGKLFGHTEKSVSEGSRAIPASVVLEITTSSSSLFA